MAPSNKGVKGQTRIYSLTESVANVIVGYWVAVASQLILFPIFGVYVTLADNLVISGWFTVISIARSYYIRRVFNRVTVRM